MNNSTTNFTIDRENKKTKIEKEFSSPKEHVWDAWTEAELLDQWWAPKPWKSKTKAMDFSEGGRRLYAMVSPEGEEHWSLADYMSITPKMSIKFRDGFCDSQGNINEDLPRSDWSVNFIETNGSTLVDIEISYKTLADLEQMTEMGFREGFTATLEDLAEILLPSIRNR